MNSNWNGGNGTVELNADIVENSAIVFGPLRSTQYAGISSFTAITDAFGVGQSNLNFSTIDTCNGLNDAWFYSNFNNNGDGTYSGFSFIVSATSLSDQVPYNTIECNGANATASGFIDIGFQVFSGTPYTNYDNLVISTLRSRGISTYNSTNDGVKYQVSGLTDLVLNSSGSYSAITTNFRFDLQ
jgi:hypothetical protein